MANSITGDLGFDRLESILSNVSEKLDQIASKNVKPKIDDSKLKQVEKTAHNISDEVKNIEGEINIDDKKLKETEASIKSITGQSKSVDVTVQVKKNELDEYEKEIDRLNKKKLLLTVDRYKSTGIKKGISDNKIIENLKSKIVSTSKRVQNNAEKEIGYYDFAQHSDPHDVLLGFLEGDQHFHKAVMSQEKDIARLIASLTELKAYYNEIGQEMPKKFQNMWDYYSKEVPDSKRGRKIRNDAIQQGNDTASQTIAKYTPSEKAIENMIKKRHDAIDAEIEQIKAAQDAAQKVAKAESDKAEAVEDSADRIAKAEERQRKAQETSSVSGQHNNQLNQLQKVQQQAENTSDAVRELNELLRFQDTVKKSQTDILDGGYNIVPFANEYKKLVEEYHDFSNEDGIKKIIDRLKELYTLRKQPMFEEDFGNEIVTLMDFLKGADIPIGNANIEKYFSNVKRFTSARQALTDYAKLTSNAPGTLGGLINEWEFDSSDTSSFEEFIDRIVKSRQELVKFSEEFPSKEALTKNLYSGFEEVGRVFDEVVDKIKAGQMTAESAGNEIRKALENAVPFTSTSVNGKHTFEELINISDVKKNSNALNAALRESMERLVEMYNAGDKESEEYYGHLYRIIQLQKEMWKFNGGSGSGYDNIKENVKQKGDKKTTAKMNLQDSIMADFMQFSGIDKNIADQVMQIFSDNKYGNKSASTMSMFDKEKLISAQRFLEVLRMTSSVADGSAQAQRNLGNAHEEAAAAARGHAEAEKEVGDTTDSSKSVKEFVTEWRELNEAQKHQDGEAFDKSIMRMKEILDLLNKGHTFTGIDDMVASSEMSIDEVVAKIDVLYKKWESLSDIQDARHDKNNFSSGSNKIADQARAEMQAEEAAYDAAKRAEIEAERAGQTISESQDGVQRELLETVSILEELNKLVSSKRIASSKDMWEFNDKLGGLFGDNKSFENTLRSIKEWLKTFDEIKKNGSRTIGNYGAISGVTDDQFIERQNLLAQKLGYNIKWNTDEQGYIHGIVSESENAVKSLDEIFERIFNINELVAKSNKTPVFSEDQNDQLSFAAGMERAAEEVHDTTTEIISDVRNMEGVIDREQLNLFDQPVRNTIAEAAEESAIAMDKATEKADELRAIADQAFKVDTHQTPRDDFSDKIAQIARQQLEAYKQKEAASKREQQLMQDEANIAKETAKQKNSTAQADEKLAESANKTKDAAEKASAGLDAEAESAKKAVIHKQQATKANQELAESGNETKKSTENAAEGINEEAEAAKKLESVWVRSQRGDAGSDNYSFVTAENPIENTRHVITDEGEVTERLVDMDKLAREIIKLDNEIYEIEQKISHARNTDDMQGTRQYLALLEHDRRDMQQILDDMVTDNNYQVAQGQVAILNNQRERAKLERELIQHDQDALMITKARADAEREMTAEFRRRATLSQNEDMSNVRAGQTDTVIANKRNIRSQDLAEYYTQLKNMGLITQELETKFSDLRLLLSTVFDTKDLAVYDSELAVLKRSLKDGIDTFNTDWDEAIKENRNRNKTAPVQESNIPEEYAKIKEDIKAITALKEQQLRLDADSRAGQIQSLALQRQIDKIEKRIAENKTSLSTNNQTIISEEEEIARLYAEQNQKLTDIKNVRSGKTIDNISSYVENNLKETDKILNGKYTTQYKNEIEKTKKDLLELKGLLENIDLKNLDADAVNYLIERFNALKGSIDNSIGEKGLGRNKEAARSSLAKLSKSIEDIMAKNSAMGRQFKSQFENLKIKVDGADSVEEVERIKAEIISLETEVIKAGKTGKSIFAQFGERLRGIAVGQIARYLSIYDLIRYTRTAVNTIQELDTALVDLKKTTTMSASELNEFYFAANDVAKNMGATTKEIIEQAAQWSRLGYSSKEAATQMAALSSQFAAISPGMDLSASTDGLVSTMKAFHVEVDDVERTIMDNVNRIGNTMATSNDEIMEMLKRSSAAMNEANNTLEETIALESAAVQVTRNAESTGTAFRTELCPCVQ